MKACETSEIELAMDVARHVGRWLWRHKGEWYVCGRHSGGNEWLRMPELSLEAAETAVVIEKLGGSAVGLSGGMGKQYDIQIDGRRAYFKPGPGIGGWERL